MSVNDKNINLANLLAYNRRYQAREFEQALMKFTPKSNHYFIAVFLFVSLVRRLLSKSHKTAAVLMLFFPDRNDKAARCRWLDCLMLLGQTESALGLQQVRDSWNQSVKSNSVCNTFSDETDAITSSIEIQHLGLETVGE